MAHRENFIDRKSDSPLMIGMMIIEKANKRQKRVKIIQFSFWLRFQLSFDTFFCLHHGDESGVTF